MREPDILIVGSGMGGGALAYGLKDCGLKVQVIERGTFLPREKENASVDEVFHKKRYRSVDVWTDGAAGASIPAFTTMSAETPRSTAPR